MFCFTLRLKQEKLQKDNLYLPELYKGRNEAIFMSYYEDISVCKTEAELLALWKTKKATTGHYMEKKQEKTVFINHQNVFISDGIVNETVWNSQDGKKILYVLKETIFYKGIMPSEKVLDFPVDCNTLTGSVNL